MHHLDDVLVREELEALDLAHDRALAVDLVALLVDRALGDHLVRVKVRVRVRVRVRMSHLGVARRPVAVCGVRARRALMA